MNSTTNPATGLEAQTQSANRNRFLLIMVRSEQITNYYSLPLQRKKKHNSSRTTLIMSSI